MKHVWLTASLLGFTLAAPASFSDLPEGLLAQQVAVVVEAGWMQGYPDGTFRGGENLNRYQLAAALGRVLQEMGVEPKPVPFADVPEGHWVREPLGRALAWDLLSGHPDGSFKGGETLTRAQLAQVLAKLAERLGLEGTSPLPWDLPKGHWAAPAVQKVVGLGLMDLNPDGSFGANAPVNRYQLAKALAALRTHLQKNPQAGTPKHEATQSPHPVPSANPALRVQSAEPVDTPARWVGTARTQVVLLGEKLLVQGPEGTQREESVPAETQAALPGWRLTPPLLVRGSDLYGPLGLQGAKGVLPGVYRLMKNGHLALDPSGNYLLVVAGHPLCDCQSRAIRLTLLLTNPVGLFAEYVYLLDDPKGRVTGVAWPNPKALLILESVGEKSRVYRVNLNAGEDIAFGQWDEGGLEAQTPLPVRPVEKTLLAELDLPSPWGLAAWDPQTLLTTREGQALKLALNAPLW
jgi:hypothetical protein